MMEIIGMLWEMTLYVLIGMAFVAVLGATWFACLFIGMIFDDGTPRSAWITTGLWAVLWIGSAAHYISGKI